MPELAPELGSVGENYRSPSSKISRDADQAVPSTDDGRRVRRSLQQLANMSFTHLNHSPIQTPITTTSIASPSHTLDLYPVQPAAAGIVFV